MSVRKKTAVPPEKLALYQRLLDSVDAPAKEYVAVPDDLLPDTKTLSLYLETSLRYALTLRPKATKKRASP